MDINKTVIFDSKVNEAILLKKDCKVTDIWVYETKNDNNIDVDLQFIPEIKLEPIPEYLGTAYSAEGQDINCDELRVIAILNGKGTVEYNFVARTGDNT
jgi:hypothetical protein